jgi:hypothetical protein
VRVTVSIDNRKQFGDRRWSGRLADVKAMQFVWPSDGADLHLATDTHTHDHTDAQTRTPSPSPVQPPIHVTPSPQPQASNTPTDTVAQHAAAHNDSHADSDTDSPGRSYVYTQAIAAFPKWTNQNNVQ